MWYVVFIFSFRCLLRRFGFTSLMQPSHPAVPLRRCPTSIPFSVPYRRPAVTRHLCSSYSEGIILRFAQVSSGWVHAAVQIPALFRCTASGLNQMFGQSVYFMSLLFESFTFKLFFVSFSKLSDSQRTSSLHVHLPALAWLSSHRAVAIFA